MACAQVKQRWKLGTSAWMGSKNFEHFLVSRKSRGKSTTRRLMQPLKLCCSVFCEPAEWFICFAKLYTDKRAASHQGKWMKLRLSMTVELPYIPEHFLWLAIDSIVVLWALYVWTLQHYYSASLLFIHSLLPKLLTRLSCVLIGC